MDFKIILIVALVIAGGFLFFNQDNVLQERDRAMERLDSTINVSRANIFDREKKINRLEENIDSLLDENIKYSYKQDSIVKHYDNILSSLDSFSSSDVNDYFSNNYEPGDSLSVIRDLEKGKRCLELDYIDKYRISNLKRVVESQRVVINEKDSIIFYKDRIIGSLETKIAATEERLLKTKNKLKNKSNEATIFKGTTIAAAIAVLILL